jgi:peptidoglycan/LPS O-acetylase OafA/YrhL
MKYKVSESGLKMIIVYLALVLLACIFLSVTIETTALASLYLIVLTIPWSLILGELALRYESIGEMALLYKIILFGAFVFLNCVILYWLGLKHDNGRDAVKETDNHQ